MAHAPTPSLDEVKTFTMPARLRMVLLGTMGVGVLFFLLSLVLSGGGSHSAPAKPAEHGTGGGEHHSSLSVKPASLTAEGPGAESHAATGEGHAAAGEGHAATSEHGSGHGGHHAAPPREFNTITRLWANLLLNGIYFGGAAALALFFMAVKNVTDAGWYVVIKRIMEAMASWLPLAAVFMLVVLALGGPMLYDWMNVAWAEGDFLVSKKTAWLNQPFFLARAAIYLGIWTLFFFLLRRLSLAEDQQGGLHSLRRTKTLSAAFIMIFALSFSASAWDWVMSLEPQWFSTMFGVYVFASCFVIALSLLTIIAIYLKENGYLPVFNSSHLHDLGKFVFGFSIFWTYIGLCQYLLIWYANIPEETIYYHKRTLGDTPYFWWFIFNAVLCFIVPFLGLMTSGSKRRPLYLALICGLLLFGHFVDLFLMIMPGASYAQSGLGLMEIGLFLVFLPAFLLWVGRTLGKAPLVPLRHPYLKESLLHNYH